MIVIVDYGMGNLGSIVNMLKKVGATATVSSDREVIERATKLILPGVGAFDHGMKNLHDLGLISVLNHKALTEKIPVLGVCLGMQLLTQKSAEGERAGLGWLAAETVKFRFDQAETRLRVPHMGWNYVTLRQNRPIFNQVADAPRFYFVHSYYVVCHDEATILATTHYGFDFTSAVVKENIVGLQFHPEKSHKFGLRLFQNFVEND
jgi:glutamine amidotransferase